MGKIDSPKAQRERDRDWLEKQVKSSQYHKVLPKLPVEGKGVWPRLVRWNGVTPGRQRTCWCEAVWGGEGDGVGEVPAFFPCEISELSLLCTHIKLFIYV